MKEDDISAPADAEDEGGHRAAILHDDIYSTLRHDLVTGGLVPGQRVSIRTLAERFETSFLPVRDALKRLVAEHALVMLPNRTVLVPMMTRERFQELLQVRLMLETMLSRQAAARIVHDEVVKLDAINEAMQQAVRDGDVRRYLAANHAFHFGLYEAGGSEVALPIVDKLWVQVGPFLNAVFNQQGTRSAGGNHAEVLKALRRHDPIGVAEAIHSDLANAADLILANVEFPEWAYEPKPRRMKHPNGGAHEQEALSQDGPKAAVSPDRRASGRKANQE
ncbi:MAG TPA: GntR family transcriptional regulator [Bordetella sp.]